MTDPDSLFRLMSKRSPCRHIIAYESNGQQEKQASQSHYGEAIPNVTSLRSIPELPFAAIAGPIW